MAEGRWDAGRKILAGGLAVAILVSGIGNYDWAGTKKGEVAMAEAAMAEEAGTVTDLIIDGSTVRTEQQNAYRGLGTVTCNNSSRLLLDYKEDHPEEYWEIMNWLFSKENGAGLCHIKIELGCDTDTSSGAEPATKRSTEEAANVNRGAGFVFAHDALTINPDITLDMLCWGMPGWVQHAAETSEKKGFQARYQWYKETLDAAYDVWGLKFSYVSANRNEKTLEKDWTVYLSRALKNESDARYDYGTIQIVAADETDTMEVAKKMLANKSYRNAVDVIGCHYNSYMDDNVKKLNQKYGKEIWFSEGASVATDTIFGANNTTDHVTTSGTNGMLDIANRIIIGYAQSNMTLYEFQPSVAAYYDGTVYFPKQLLAANHPWSGYYQLTAGMVMAMHFNHFIDKGWQYVDSGSYGDGMQANHYITDTKNDYLTAADPSSDNYSTVITNDSSTARAYQVKVSNLAAASSPVNLWETRSPIEGESYDAGWLNLIHTITPVENDGVYTYTVTVAPYSMVTLTTTAGQKSYAQLREGTRANNEAQNTALSLPYSDGFEYNDEFISRRGGTPKYTTDQDGAFEVVALEDGSKVLMQKITRDILPASWSGRNENPVTSLGDDTWKDYTVSVDAKIDDESTRKGDYVGLCARYNCTESVARNGYWLRVYQDGRWKLTASTGQLASGQLKGKQNGKWLTLKITVLDNVVFASINGVQVASKTVSRSLVNSGRIALGSTYANNCYDNINVSPVTGGCSNITRIDDLDSRVSVTGNTTREQSLSYFNYGRTLTTLKKPGDTISFSFHGTGVSLLGQNDAKATMDVILDGEVREQGYTTKNTDSRAVFYRAADLADGDHTITLKLTGKNEIALDALEVQGAVWQDTSLKATGITLGMEKAELGYGQMLDMRPVLLGEAPTDTITYTSSNANVAMITSDGILHGNGGGKATVTATTENGFSASCEVSVIELKLTPAAGICLGAGEKVTLKAACQQKTSETRSVKWHSSDSKIAVVTQKGKVKTQKEGKVVITARTEGGLERSTTILVSKAPSQIKFKKKKLTLKKGESKQLKYSLPYGSLSSKVTYRSSKTKIVSVSKKGIVRAKKTGAVTITVKTYNGKTAKMKVKVKSS